MRTKRKSKSLAPLAPAVLAAVPGAGAGSGGGVFGLYADGGAIGGSNGGLRADETIMGIIVGGGGLGMTLEARFGAGSGGGPR